MRTGAPYTIDLVFALMATDSSDDLGLSRSGGTVAAVQGHIRDIIDASANNAGYAGFHITWSVGDENSNSLDAQLDLIPEGDEETSSESDDAAEKFNIILREECRNYGEFLLLTPEGPRMVVIGVDLV